jgi:hypothetical protein
MFTSIGTSMHSTHDFGLSYQFHYADLDKDSVKFLNKRG